MASSPLIPTPTPPPLRTSRGRGLTFPRKTRRQALRAHVLPVAWVLPGLLAAIHGLLVKSAWANGRWPWAVLATPLVPAAVVFERWFRQWRDDARTSTPPDVVLYTYLLGLMGAAALSLMALRFGH
jgi:hypothetical protein